MASSAPADPPVTVMLTYPNVDDAVFNYDYYLQTHMPLAEQVWRPLGLVGVSLGPTAHEAGKAPYNVVCLLEFSSRKDWDRAWEAALTQLVHDVPNFSNQMPTFLIGERFAGTVEVGRV
ncbi:uncharacterized protein J3D65DRAFT_664485 [Phyllosticta citribraziliensis]|uniref:EthD domain-containing protein n=1 Tax=Phyllosticta citribraziliensis TaxID=989973 RepID=A0ABR1M533_9PEZI